jgi:hypothetical protein
MTQHLFDKTRQGGLAAGNQSAELILSANI